MEYNDSGRSTGTPLVNKLPAIAKTWIFINLLTPLTIIASQMSIAHTNSSYFLQLHHPVIYVQFSQVFVSLQVYIFEMDPAFPHVRPS